MPLANARKLNGTPYFMPWDRNPKRGDACAIHPSLDFARVGALSTPGIPTLETAKSQIRRILRHKFRNYFSQRRIQRDFSCLSN
jgi:hypothetical protein